MRRIHLFLLIILSLPIGSGSGFAAALTLEWDSSPDPDVVGYNIYCGVASQQYTDLIGAELSTTATLTNLAAGFTYYFAATCVNSAGLESDFSSEVAFQIGSNSCTVTLSNLVQIYDGGIKQTSVATTPPGLAVSVAYNGLPDPPTEAGVYAITATVIDPAYSGLATNTLIVEQANADVILADLDQTYDGTPKQIWAMSSPPGLALILTYNGAPDWPVNAGTYEVTGSIEDPNYTGSATNTLSILKASASIQLANLNQIYDGSPKPVAATTVPAGLQVVLTYNGQPQPPSAAGTYAVLGSVVDPNYQGSAMNWLTVAPGAGVASPLGPVLAIPGYSLSTATLPPAPAKPSFLLFWPKTATGVTIWQSSDLVTWTPFTNLTGNSLLISPNSASVFYKATSIGPDGTSVLPLFIHKP